MKDVRRLRRRFPDHIAFNLALLLRRLRPVVQIDAEDAHHLPAIFKTLPKVDFLTHSNGTLLFFDVPARTRECLDKIRLASPFQNVHKLVGDALKLVCSSGDTKGSDFRILIGVMDINDSEWYFKAQMCTRASHIMSVFEEMLKYESLADEMGMIATTLKIIRVIPKLRTW